MARSPKVSILDDIRPEGFLNVHEATVYRRLDFLTAVFFCHSPGLEAMKDSLGIGIENLDFGLSFDEVSVSVLIFYCNLRRMYRSSACFSFEKNESVWSVVTTGSKSSVCNHLLLCVLRRGRCKRHDAKVCITCTEAKEASEKIPVCNKKLSSNMQEADARIR